MALLTANLDPIVVYPQREILWRVPPPDVYPDDELVPPPTIEIHTEGELDTGIQSGEVTVELTDNEEGATLTGPLTADAAGGVAEFPGLSIDRVGSYSLIVRCDEESITYAPTGLEIGDAMRFLDMRPSTGDTFAQRRTCRVSGITFTVNGGTMGQDHGVDAYHFPQGTSLQADDTELMRYLVNVRREFTFIAWLYGYEPPNKTSDTQDLLHVLAINRGQPLFVQISHSQSNGNRLFSGLIYGSGGGTAYTTGDSGPVPRGTFAGANMIHLTKRLEDGSWVYRLGINGTTLDTRSSSNIETNVPDYISGRVRIGGHWLSEWEFGLRQLGFWSRALTDAEILEQARRCGVAP